MALALTKGANAPLGDAAITIGVGWGTSSSWDIDASAFLVGADGKVRSDRDFVFYNQVATPCGSLRLNTEPAEDQRQFQLMLDSVSPEVVKIVFTLTIGADTATDTCPHCGLLDDLYIRVMASAGAERLRYELTQLGQERALMLGEVYRHRETWKFRAVGQGFNGGLAVLASELGVNIDEATADAPPLGPVDYRPVGLSRRKSAREVWEERVVALQQALSRFLPQIEAAVANQSNESNTRMILDRILMDAFGYSMDEIKAEQKVQGRKADYVLAVGDLDALVGEAKRAGLPLRDKHVFQATSYGAYSGIRWALLTNLATWQVYHIATQDMVEAKLVFSVDLLPNLTLENCERLLLISRYGLSRKGLLEKYWHEVNALTRENLIRAILTEDVIRRVRLVIRRDTGCSFSDDQIQHALEDLVIHL